MEALSRYSINCIFTLFLFSDNIAIEEYNMKIILFILLFMIFIPTANAHYLVGSGKDYSSNDACVIYDEDNDVIEICGGEFDIHELASFVDNHLLYKDDAWVLNSSLTIGFGSKLYLIKDDLEWLKILNNKQNHIEVRGELIIDGIKITSWDAKREDYAKLKSVNDYRPHIVAVDYGSLKISDAFIGYLGYDAGRSHGLDFYEGRDHHIINSTIVGNYFGAYTDKVDSMLIMDNMIYNNHVYGLDPHTYSKNIRIINNTVYNNGYHGIICSRFCNNIEIINNTVYNNIGHGIMLDRNVTNSIVSNNIIINNDAGIMLFTSNHNTIKDNIIKDNKHGIRASYGSSYNSISSNKIDNSRTYGIYILKDAYNNNIDGNVIDNTDDAAIYIDDALKSINIISDNIITSVINYNIRLRDAYALFINNTYACNKVCFFLDSNNHLLHINDNLYNITYKAKTFNTIEVIDEDNYIYSNSMNIPQTITNVTKLEFAIDDTLKINREDIRVFTDNPIILLYKDGVMDISANTLTDIMIDAKENYHITNYLDRDGNNFTIVGNSKIYAYNCNNALEIGIDKYLEVCSLNDITMHVSNYLYSINTVIVILIGFSIFSFILIIRK
jgi:parallel beta-helix repeat protein